ncbi:D-ribose transporter ATP-binding protein [Burkholderia stagnalis]|uniref:sugar ABC transporter ATP-binding protein n=1 Tax=Burkholderia stagnalis TaxID=1503054 RepID=UPI00075B5D74|nr:sugar ABC transporter ATP-binding protein [Burkholderia stagnalis]AOK56900.1 D-ribose transporter ATP-binding protein [Burkholderia stagnalis]KVN83850.1 D-ribose transporter ATP-binding protein [Burkholderia stagnalis]KWO36736.1 D-ribose transporter ATP-binding protein [Burkholderia stagnalis]KWO44664.1 D-ribose transporter ATP-binding protein [Burkholderia stagnalis]MDY7804436.1 sugar ABC transporter ATP-binding protein [Burkholderia stagnalis]
MQPDPNPLRVTHDTPAHAPLIALRGVSKRFPGVQALDDCRFDLLAGEVHALMGENGAGKSTLMKILAGVYRKDGGEILLNGRAVEVADPRAAQALGIGIIHQELNLMNHLSVAQNIFIGREPRGRLGVFIDEARLNRDAAAIFARMRLDLDPRTPVGRLTVARQQMVEIAKALSFDSRVLIMDEPTAALNDAEIAELFRIIGDLRAHGVGIVYISHKMDELRRIADRVTVMRDGKTVATVPMAGTSMESIITMMVGRALDTQRRTPPDTSANDVVLDVRGLSRGRAIRDVGFTLRRGEILGFAGLMGAGRTEVVRAIFGADPLDAGEIRVHGATVTIRTPADAVAHGIGYLSEDRKHFGLALGMDVQNNIALSSLRRFARRGGLLDARAMRDTAQAYVRRLAIRTPSVVQPARLLSGGNQQKIVIAKWLLRDCDILFFDEPTRGIDVGAKSEIYTLLDALAAAGKAIVMISSELPEVLRMSHRILVMCEGRVTGELSAAEATQETIMQLATRRESSVAR